MQCTSNKQSALPQEEAWFTRLKHNGWISAGWDRVYLAATVLGVFLFLKTDMNTMSDFLGLMALG